MTTKSQEERAQILSSTAAFGIASKACENYVHRLMAVNNEAMNFLNSRLRQDVELGESFARCKSWQEVSELQQAWGRKAFEDYAAMSKKLMELSSLMVENPWAPTAVEEEKKPALTPVEQASARKSEATKTPATEPQTVAKTEAGKTTSEPKSAETNPVSAKAADPLKAAAKPQAARKRTSKRGSTVTTASTAKPASSTKPAEPAKPVRAAKPASAKAPSATRPQKA